MQQEAVDADKVDTVKKVRRINRGLTYPSFVDTLREQMSFLQKEKAAAQEKEMLLLKEKPGKFTHLKYAFL